MRADVCISARNKGRATLEVRIVELLTYEELARRLRVQPSTVERWSRRGQIPKHVLTPKVVRFELEPVVEALTMGQGVKR